MSELSKEKAKTRLEKKLGQEICSNFRAKSTSELELELLNLVKAHEGTVFLRDSDPEYIMAKEKFDEVKNEYRYKLKEYKDKIKFFYNILREERGEQK